MLQWLRQVKNINDAKFVTWLLTALAGILVWSLSYFATSAEVSEIRRNAQFDSVKIDKIADDVSWIRGRLRELEGNK